MIKSILCVVLAVLFMVIEGFTPDAYGASARRSRRQQKNTPQKVMTRFVTVTVEGSGETLALAQKNAKDNAIAKVVGQALKGKTQILESGDTAKVTSEYVSAAAGFISDYQELSRKKEGNIFVVSAKVTVYQDKLYEAIVFKSDETAQDNIELGNSDETIREDMTRFIVSYMIDYCRIWRIQAQQIIPEVDAKGNPVLYVNFYFGSTQELYNMYFNRLRQAMAKVKAREIYGNKRFDRKMYQTLSIVTNPGAQTPVWTRFLLEKKYLEDMRVFNGEFEKYGYKLTVELLDADGEVIRTEVVGGQFHSYNLTPEPAWGRLELLPLRGEEKKSSLRSKFQMAFTNFSDKSEMLKVKKVRAKLEPVKRRRENALEFRQHFIKWGWYE